ncbi:MAG: SDR family oxidoreductase, partial [Cyanobacteria bacterium]|nr:SDR family oxidoreductase [Cyanobacteriota bacterium]
MQTQIANEKTAIVTGASSGIGLSLVKSLLTKGYTVIANSRSLIKSKVLEATEKCFLIDGDVAFPEVGKALTETAIQETGRIDLVVNNAGIFLPGNFHEYSEEQYRSIMATNADGFFYVTQPAVQHMLKHKYGHIVSISTTL